MKKIIALALIPAMLLMTVTGCTQAQKEAKQAKKAEQLQTFYDENWDNDSGSYEKDVLPTKEAAEAVAQQIFDSIKEEYGKEEYELIYATYYKAENAWMVFFHRPWKEGELMPMGGGCTIALNKANGQVVRVFWGQ